MIAWMLYAIALGGLFGVAALAGERALRLFRRPVRFVWLLAVLVSAGFPLLALALRPAPGSMARLTPIVVWGEGAGPLQASADLLGRVSVVTVSLERVVLAAWLVTTTALLSVLAWSWIRLRREGLGWAERTIDGYRVRISAEVGPAVTDPVAGTIVLPGWLAAASADERRLALAHELEHRDAGDARLLWLTLLVAAAFPWNPGLWWQVLRLRRAVELDCDSRVLAAGASRKTYAQLLLRVGERVGRTSLLSPALIERRSLLRGRIDAMIERTVKFRLLRALSYGAAAVFVGVVACETPAPPGMDEPTGPAEAVVGPDRVYAEQVVDAAPERLSCPPPEYPSILREAGIEGQVVIQFVVERDGTVEQPTVQTLSSSHRGFEEPARAMIEGCRFRAGAVRGEPVRTLVQMPVIFTLQRPARVALRADSLAVRVLSSESEERPSPVVMVRDSALSEGPGPLYVVDGLIVGNPAVLNVDTLDIETIEVVRGAEVERRYGDRARNGVVLITTKRN